MGFIGWEQYVRLFSGITELNKSKMKTLQIDERKARKLYKTASAEFKQTLEDTFGKEFFEQDVTGRINDLKDCFAETGRPATPAFSDVSEDLRDCFRSLYNLIVVTEAYNGGEKMDIYNKDVNRHYPWFACNGSSSAFGFRIAFYGGSIVAAGSGSRLSFKESRLATDAGRKFKNVYRDFFTK